MTLTLVDQREEATRKTERRRSRGEQAEVQILYLHFALWDDFTRKKRLNSGIARKWGGGLPMPEFFGPFFPPSNFHHTRKTSFLSAGKKRTKVPELGGGGF